MENDTKKVYTAEEIRKMANAVVDESDFQDANCTVVYKEIYCCGKLFRPSVIAAMLLQAAEISERCVKIRDKYTPYYGKNDGEVDAIVDMVDYVQMGKEN